MTNSTHIASPSRSAYIPMQARPWVSRLAKAMTVWLLAQNLFAVMPASAQTVLPTTPDKNAPSGQRPIMDAAQNGVPIVHIAPPSAAGVSRNQYDQFNVNSNGLILNNSTGNVQTQLGGWITGNMQLGPTPARIILNEVTGNNNSQLRGTIEVAGQRADIVIANPNGITCDGCGFLNTTRTTLTTGQPQFGAGGSLDALDVRQGQITVGGNGLNATNLEQLDLIARGMVIEGEVWAKNLNAIAGANKVLYGTLQQTVQTGSGPAPQFAIDIKDLGGMYANQVYMIATDKGLGVNSTGRVAALQGNLLLSANGDLTLKDTYAKQNIQLASTGNATLAGDTLSEGSTTINVDGKLTQQGKLDVQNQLNIAAGSVSNSGTVVQRGTQGLQITSSGDIENTGTLYSASKIDAAGAAIHNQDGEIGAASVSLSGTALNNAHGIIAANYIAVHVANGTLDNTQGQLSAQTLAIESNNIKNDAGVIASNAAIDLDLRGGSLSNTNNGQLISNADVKIANARVDNTKGTIASATGTLQINAVGKQLLNDEGTLRANGNVDLAVGDVSNQKGLIYGQDLTLQTTSFNNDQGSVAANGKATLSTGAFSNVAGLLQSAGDMQVDTHNASLTNTGSGPNGGIVAGGNLTLDTGSLNNSDGLIASTAAQATATIRATSLDNSGGTIASNGKAVLTTGALANAAGLLQSAGDLEINTGSATLTNTASGAHGGIVAGGNLTLDTGSIDNQGGLIADIGNQTTATIRAALLDNSGGTIAANGKAVLTTGALTNNAGLLQSAGDLQINTGLATLTNTASGANGGIVAGGNLTLDAGSINNQGGIIAGTATEATTTIRATSLDNSGGSIVTNGKAVLTTGALTNAAGLLQSASDLNIDTGTATLTNTDSGASGGIIAGAKLTVNAGNVNNRGGFIASTGNQSISATGNIDNSAAGQIVTDSDATLVASQIQNQQGSIQSLGNVSLTANTLNNASGTIAANKNVTLNVTSFDSRALPSMAPGMNAMVSLNATNLPSNSVLSAGQAMTINASDLTNAGQISGQSVALNVTGTLDNNATGLIDGEDTRITTSTLNNSGRIYGDTLRIDAGTVNNNSTGVMTAHSSISAAGQTTSINAGSLNNAGEISGQNVALNVTGTLNNTSTGIIDGTDTRINAGVLNNTGRLYGDMLRINAGTINNDSTGVIAARNTLLLGAQYLNNTNGALIYSLGDIIMAGILDANGTPQGQMQSLVNSSSRIEANSNLAIASSVIDNRNDRLATTIVADAPVHQEYVQSNEGAHATYTTSLCFNVGSGGDKVQCIVHPDKYGQRQNVPPLYHEECTFTGWGEPGNCSSTPNYDLNSPSTFAQFGVIPVGPEPVEPGEQVGRWWVGRCWAGEGDNVYLVQTSECIAWDAADRAWKQQYQDSLVALNDAINAYNASVNEDNRLDVFEDYTWFKVDSTTSRPVVIASAPAQILAGGNMTLTGATFNRDSEIVAGGAISIVGPAVQNIATKGEVRTVYSGTSQFTHVESCGWDSHCREWDAVNPYNPAPNVQSFDLPILRYQAYAGNQTAVRAVPDAPGATGTAPSVIVMAGEASLRGSTASPVTTSQTPQTLTAPQAPSVAGTSASIRTLSVPSSSLFIVHAEPAARYLVETDPRFTNYKTFISSDYFLQALNLNPTTQQKRYGDGFAEQQRINDQILALTGRRYLDGYSSTETEYTALMNAGVAFAQAYQLTPGVTLTAAQMALLTTDIVWLETQTVQLADGSTQQVLVPQVYLRRAQDGDLQPSGALIAGSSVTIQSQGDLVNSGTIAGNTVTATAGNDLVNQNGRVSGQNIVLTAGRDLSNLSGVITGTGTNSTVNLLAGRDLILQTQTIGTTSADGNSTRTNVQRIATVQGGTVQLGAGRDMTLAGANVSADNQLTAIANGNVTISAVAAEYQLNVKDRSGKSMADGIDAGVTRTGYIQENATTNQLASMNSGGNLTIAAGSNLAVKGADIKAGTSGTGDAVLQAQNVSIEGVKDRLGSDVQIVYDKGYTRTARDNETYVSGQVTAANNLSIIATGKDSNGNNVAGQGNVTITGGYLSTDQGQLTVAAANDIAIKNDSTNHLKVDDSYFISSNLLSTTKEAKASTVASTHVEGSVLSGNSVVIAAGDPTTAVGNITVTGSAIVADKDVTISAGRNVTLDAGQETSDVYQASRKETSGAFGSGAGFTIGSKELTQKQSERTLTNVGSSVGSLNGNVTIAAGNDYAQQGSQVSAAGDIDITAKRIDIGAAADSGQSESETKFKQSGLSVSVSAPIIDSLLNTAQQAEATAKVKDSRFKAMGAMNTAMAGMDAAKNLGALGGANPGQSASVSLSLTVGSSQSESKQTQSGSTAVGSTLQAGNNITLAATGDGSNSHLNVVGSDIAAGKNVTLKSDGDINLQAAQSTFEQHSTNKSSSAAVGVAVSVDSNGGASFGVTASASAGRGHADGQDVTQSNTHITAGNTLTLDSQGDTNLKGAVASGQQVIATVGGNLNIASLQDTSTYHSKDESIGGSVTVGFGFSGSVNYSNSKVDGDYASVTEQSGIKAGDGGYQVTVNGNTDLKGGAIASSQTAIDNNKNSLTTGTLTVSDIQNHANYSASSVAVGGGFSMGSGNSKGSGDSSATADSSGAHLQSFSNGKSASAGVGSDSGSDSSVTKSGISGGTLVITNDKKQQELTGKTAEQTVASVNRAITSDSASGGIAKNWDAQALKEEVQTQAQIMQTFGATAAKEIGDYAKSKEDNLRIQADAAKAAADAATAVGDTAAAESAAASAKALNAEADKWAEGGAYRVALHAAAGALSGGVEGALGATASAASAKLMDDLQKDMQASLTNLGVSSDTAKLIAQGATGAVSTGLGATVGGAAGAATALNTDFNNRQLHDAEKARIKALANGDPQKEGRLTAAACALIKCYAEYPEGSPIYQQLKQIADIGASSAYAGERQLLLQQSGQFTYSTGWLFSDEKIDAAKRLNNTYQITTRTVGALQAVGGAATAVTGTAITAGGAVTCPETGLGCAVAAGGATLTGWGLDQSKAGVTTLATGQPQSTVGATVLQNLFGISPTAAELLYGTVGGVAGIAADAALLSGGASVVKGGTGANSGLPKTLPENLEGFANPKDIKFTQDSVANTFKDGTTLQSTINDLKSGKLLPSDLPPIRVFEKDGVVYTLDNRRLLAASEAGVPIKVVPATTAEITKEAWKMTTPNGGSIICIRGICK